MMIENLFADIIALFEIFHVIIICAVNVDIAALLYQILSLHSKIVLVKSHVELWSNITGLAVSTVSNRSVYYVQCDLCYYVTALSPY